jgi:hypothetical protein
MSVCRLGRILHTTYYLLPPFRIVKMSAGTIDFQKNKRYKLKFKASDEGIPEVITGVNVLAGKFYSVWNQSKCRNYNLTDGDNEFYRIYSH